MKSVIDNLVWIHEKIAEGTTQERWKDSDVFVYERMGGHHLLVGLNDNQVSDFTVTVQTGFGANVQLHDYTGHGPDVRTDGNGKVTITVPKNSYVAYSKTGITGGFATVEKSVTQEFAGATDLDIKPADNTALVTVGRIYAKSGKPITTSLYYDTAGWTSSTRIYVELIGPDGARKASKDYYTSTGQGASFAHTPGSTGWYTFNIRSFNTPSGNEKPKYWLKTTYTAPQTF